MADKLAGFVPDTMNNNEPIREPIVRLGKLITDRLPVKSARKKSQRNRLNTGDLLLYVQTRWQNLLFLWAKESREPGQI